MLQSDKYETDLYHFNMGHHVYNVQRRPFFILLLGLSLRLLGVP